MKKAIRTILLSLMSAVLCVPMAMCLSGTARFSILDSIAAPVGAASYLDEIQVYNITVDMRPDGTMDLVYHLEWKVLDDRSEGPLEWVKIGIPNSSSDSYAALSDNISSIDYYYDNGDFVRIDFDRSYYKDEIISFDFSFHQTRMYTLNNEKNLCIFDFIPGWFNEIEVKSYLLQWNGTDVTSSDATGMLQADSIPSAPAGGYLTWRGSLAAGEHVYTHVEYSLGTFKTSSDMQYIKQEEVSWSGQTEESQADAPFVLIPFFLFIAFVILSIFANTKNGRYRGGFGSHFIGRGGGGGIGGGGCACASSCACACACACAGGGRAGCSAKNLYGPSIRF
ncbi:MAG: hypothetical protein ACYCYM_12595 [Saccharofermentanales bacterium]